MDQKIAFVTGATGGSDDGDRRCSKTALKTGKSRGWLLSALLLLSGWCLPFCSQAGVQADRALGSVQRLIDSGEVTPGTVLRLVVKQGNIANFLGKNYELKHEWERATGILLDAGIMPQRASLSFIRDASNVDITIARNREFADLYDQQLITDLTPILEHFGFSLDSSADDGYLLPALQARYGDRIVAIPADSDMAVLYLRRDLLEDEGNQAEFRRRYGVELTLPQTWEQYQRQVEFFHDPKNDFYGSLEQRDPLSSWMFWIPRYAARNQPSQYLFDKQMHPLIDSTAGISATQSYMATVPYSPSRILELESNYTYTLPLFMNGKGFSTIITLAGAKLFSSEASRIKGRFVAVPMPGVEQDGRIHRRTTLIYGNNIVIPQNSPNKELALLFGMWLTDPDISIRSITVKGGFSDPYRHHHFDTDSVIATYTAQVLETVRSQLGSVVPAGTGLPGDAEYIDALNHNLHLAAAGGQSAAEAMKNTAREWEAITERYGREKQIRRWLKVISLYPDVSFAADGNAGSDD